MSFFEHFVRYNKERSSRIGIQSLVNDHCLANTLGRTPAQFEICIRAWKLTFVTKESRQMLIDYCKQVKKP
jgi:hypothetical protein